MFCRPRWMSCGTRQVRGTVTASSTAIRFSISNSANCRAIHTSLRTRGGYCSRSSLLCGYAWLRAAREPRPGTKTWMRINGSSIFCVKARVGSQSTTCRKPWSVSRRQLMTTGRDVAQMPADLSGKVVVLTGGADGIGRECALAYARQQATVAIVDRDLDAAVRTASEAGGGCIALHADVSDGEAVRLAVGAVLERLGRIDAVHNNAGIASPSKPLHETSELEWDDLLRVNLKSVYWTTRFAFEALQRSKGAILNTASMVGLIGQQNHAAYAATKGAMISLTKAMAADYAPYGIRVNAVCPAGVWTPMLEEWAADQPEP